MTSWEKVILSWVNVCGICAEQIEKVEDLFDGKLLGCFLLSHTKDDPGDPFQKLLKFIQRCYPDFWTPTPSNFQNEDVLILYSVLVHFYSFNDNSFVRNKMCCLTNASQLQIKNFLECLMNKDVTKDSIIMAIESCETATVKSPVEVYQSTPKHSRRGKSKTPLQDFLNSPAAKEQKRYSEIKKLEVELQTERDVHLFYEQQLEDMKKEKDRMESKKDKDIKKLQAKLSESHAQIGDILCEKEREIAKQAENINVLNKDLHNRKDEIIALLKKVAVLDEELTEKRIMVNNLSETKLTSERMICENEILRNEKTILETKLIETEESVKELNNKIQSLDEDLNQKQKAIDDLMKMQTEENDSIKKESEEHLKAAEVLKAKYTDLKLKFFEKAKECGNMKSIYEEKLARLKEQMQAAYNKEKEKILVQNNSATNELEKTLQMYKEKFMQHRGDNVDLRTQVWDLSEKLLRANDEKAKLQTRLSSLLNNQAKHSALGEVSKFALEQHPVDRWLSQYIQSSDRSQIVMDVINESVTYVRRRTRSCRKSIPPGIGQAFPPQDEEGEEFNAKYLADMKAGRCLVEQGEKGRLTEYQHRNSMVLPHLKSSYPVTDCKELLEATEDDVKFGTGGDLDNFDTLSTSLLLPDRKKNKDRGRVRLN